MQTDKRHKFTTEERVRTLIPIRGYIVLGSNYPYPIGHIINDVKSGVNHRGGSISQPLALVCETDTQDSDEQERILEEAGDIVDPDVPDCYEFAYYYRFTTD